MCRPLNSAPFRTARTDPTATLMTFFGTPGGTNSIQARRLVARLVPVPGRSSSRTSILSGLGGRTPVDAGVEVFQMNETPYGDQIRSTSFIAAETDFSETRDCTESVTSIRHAPT